MRLAQLLLTLALCVPTTMALAQTGKIAGRVTDAATGEALPGVNVIIDGTTQGAVTDVEGYYTVLNVRPGTYNLRASFIGYTPVVREDVRVNIDLTTEVNFELQEETVGLEELVVAAERPIVQRDVSANVANISAEDVADLPVAGVSEVLDLQAGVEPGLQIRGGGLNEVAFVVDGMNMRTGRAHEPFTNISYTSLEEVQVQTGGFNAEYGNVRAGIVNVVTKEPPSSRYTFDGLFRYTPAQEKALNSMGALPENCDFTGTSVDASCDNYWSRPALDPFVGMVGTDSAKAAGMWDVYTERQYRTFVGWEKVASDLQTSGFDVTPQDLIEYYRYTHRKDNAISIPDYQADFTLGGPLVPGLSEKLGNLRFLASYRGTQAAYLLPQTRDAFTERTLSLKLISNVAPGMKLTLNGMSGRERGMNRYASTANLDPWQGDLPVYPWHQTAANLGSEIDQISAERGDLVFSNAQLALANIDHTMLGAQFTHTLSPNTFYEVRLQRLSSKYRSQFPHLRDATFVCPSSGMGPNGEACEPGTFVRGLFTDNFGRLTELGEQNRDRVVCFGGNQDLNGDGNVTPYCAGEEPFGYSGTGGNLLTGESTGGHWVKTRDTSDVRVWTGKFDLTSQLNRFLQVQTGVELIYSDYDMHFANVNLELFGPDPEFDYPWKQSPIQGGAYGQSKLEFRGMVANLGVRLDYFDPNTDWWAFESAYDRALGRKVDVIDTLRTKEGVGGQLFVSPRLGISFPITENSKLYFNYGHFRQMLDPFNVFGIQQSTIGGINEIGNPEHPMPKTVAYELGFDQNILNLFLLRVAGFYRDIRFQERTVTFVGIDPLVNYVTRMPWNYEDVRGAEFTLSKNRGQWFRGFLNYTYLQRKSGNFGFSAFYENQFEMRNYLLRSQDYRLSSPLAEPFARMNLLFSTPDRFGPEVAGVHPLSGWIASFLGEWRKGAPFIWSGTASIPPELQENVAWKDYWNFDLRFTKHFRTAVGNAQFFMDVSNVFNIHHLYSSTAFAGTNDDTQWYLKSLHLPEDILDQLSNVDEDAPFHQKAESLPYLWVPGKDRPGDFRKPGVAFQPIEAVMSLPATPEAGTERGWRYVLESQQYFRWNGSSWVEVPRNELDRVLDDKAYIDMPNFGFVTFLNPRRVTFGIRITF